MGKFPRGSHFGRAPPLTPLHRARVRDFNQCASFLRLSHCFMINVNIFKIISVAMAARGPW